MVPAKLSLRNRALKFQSLLISQACFSTRGGGGTFGISGWGTYLYSPYMAVPPPPPGFSSETLKMQGFLSFFFFSCVGANRESWSQAFLAEIMETGDKHCNLTDNLLHCRLRN